MKRPSRQKRLIFFGATTAVVGAALLFVMTKENHKEKRTPLPTAQSVTPKMPLVAIATEEDSRSRESRVAIENFYAATQYEQANAVIDNDLKDPHTNVTHQQWLLRQKPIVLTAWGWQKIQKGTCEEALPILTTAWQHNKQAEALKGIIYCRHQTQDHEDVVRLANEYLVQQPLDASMRVLISDSYESLGEFATALSMLNVESAGEESTTPLQNEAQLMAKKLAESEHQEKTQSEHFQMTFRRDEHAALASESLHILEQAWHELVGQFALDLGQRVYEVILYPDQSFREISHQAPAWSGGVFDGRIRIPVSHTIEAGDKQQLRRILRHEFFHAVLSALAQGRGLPTWLHEGGAQLFECEGRCRPFPFAARPTQFLSAEKFSASFLGSSAPEAALLYQQSLYLVMNLQFGQLTNETDPIGVLLQKITSLEKTDNDGVLAPYGLTFSYFYRVSADRWKQRYAF